MEFSQEQKAYAEIVQKAWDNADFKKELTANPIGKDFILFIKRLY